MKYNVTTTRQMSILCSVIFTTSRVYSPYHFVSYDIYVARCIITIWIPIGRARKYYSHVILSLFLFHIGSSQSGMLKGMKGLVAIAFRKVASIHLNHFNSVMNYCICNPINFQMIHIELMRDLLPRMSESAPMSVKKTLPICWTQLNRCRS